MIAADEQDAIEALWQIEVGRTLGLIKWLIQLAEAVYGRWGDDIDKWDLNGPLRLAIERGRADLTETLLYQDLSGACARGDKAITDLANAIAVRLGEEVQSYWSPNDLAALAEWVTK